ncbi:MAG: GNAT family N-acetyltransferase [Bacilli bacterium]|nr:GNAT family N-acetyltransferase [Bacilli bacterium]
MIEVEVLKKKDIASYIDFIKEIFDYNVDSSAIEKLIRKNKVLIIKRDERVVASATLEERFEYIKNQKFYYLSYLGVLKEYRRRGYATKIFEKINELVQENNISYLELTSGNQRRVAHYFYKSKDFKIKDTTVFVKFY